MNKIAIVNAFNFGTIYPEHIQRLEKLAEVTRFSVDENISGKDLANKLQGYNIIIAGISPTFGKEFFDHKDELKLITRHGIGFDTVDICAAKEHNTVVSIIPALIERDAVAEGNVTNLLAIMKQTVAANESVRNDKWEDRVKFVGDGLSGATVGVIGIGNIGSRIAEILNYGFRCNVLGYDPYISDLEIERAGAISVDFNYLLENADVICLAASLNNDNYHMLSNEEFNLMKDGVYISNAARGALINEEAMVKALKNKKVRGFATDVLEVEPGRKGHPYLQFENVIITPHTAAFTMSCLKSMGETNVTDCYRIINSQLPVRPVQSESIYIN